MIIASSDLGSRDTVTARRPRLRLTEAWATGFALTGSLLFKISTLNVSGWAAKYNTKLAFLRLRPEPTRRRGLRQSLPRPVETAGPNGLTLCCLQIFSSSRQGFSRGST